MKKKIVVILAGIYLIPGIAGAEEMIVNLRSGASLLIRYSGTIQGVALQGGSDAITGIIMPTTGEKEQPPLSSGRQEPESAAESKKEVSDSAKEGTQMKWVDPIQEDEPFPKRK